MKALTQRFMIILYEKEWELNTKTIALRVLLSGCRRLVRSKYVWHYKANTLHLFINDNLNMYINDHLRMYTSDYALI